MASAELIGSLLEAREPYNETLNPKPLISEPQTLNLNSERPGTRDLGFRV